MTTPTTSQLITQLHTGLNPDQLHRLDEFVAARSLDDDDPALAVLICLRNAITSFRQTTQTQYEFAGKVAFAIQSSQLLAELAEQMPACEALDISLTITEEYVRSQALLLVARKIPPDDPESLRPRILSEIRSINDDFVRSTALIKLVDSLPEDKRAALITEAVQIALQIDDPYFQSIALTDAASNNILSDSPTILEDALTSAMQIENDYLRYGALRALAPLFPPDRAFALAQLIGDEDYRADALSAIPARLSPEEALPVARRICVGTTRVRALIDIAARMDGSEKNSVLEEALECALLIEKIPARSLMLAELTVEMPPEKALRITRQIEDPYFRDQALADASVRQNPKLALEIIPDIKNPAFRAHALANLVPLVPPEQQNDVAHQALTCALQISNNRTLSAALADIIPFLPASSLEEVWQKLIDCKQVAPFWSFASRWGDLSTATGLSPQKLFSTTLQKFGQHEPDEIFVLIGQLRPAIEQMGSLPALQRIVQAIIIATEFWT